MELKLATEAQMKEAFARDLAAAFPPAELKPLREMISELRRGEYRPWCLFDGDELVGEAFVWTCGHGWSLFDYLCVSESRRSDGLGSAMIQMLLEAERGNVLFGEAEIPAYADDSAMAERRLGFYKRNGARRAGYDVCVFGVPYHTLFWADGDVPDDDIRRAHEATYRSRFSDAAYRRFITIPWDESAGLPKKTPWLG
ncbi:MAG: GNAT family N-acetyltransferase [Oscillospiraceae bacterium]|nr:GNAT family N-acetyltransferase [Oscillospiraceae bacterium]